jgi:hypothetical protein
LPDEIIHKLNAMVNQALGEEAVAARIRDLSTSPRLSTPAETISFIRSECADFGAIARPARFAWSRASLAHGGRYLGKEKGRGVLLDAAAAVLSRCGRPSCGGWRCVTRTTTWCLSDFREVARHFKVKGLAPGEACKALEVKR